MGFTTVHINMVGRAGLGKLEHSRLSPCFAHSLVETLPCMQCFVCLRSRSRRNCSQCRHLLSDRNLGGPSGNSREGCPRYCSSSPDCDLTSAWSCKDGEHHELTLSSRWTCRPSQPCRHPRCEPRLSEYLFALTYHRVENIQGLWGSGRLISLQSCGGQDEQVHTVGGVGIIIDVDRSIAVGVELCELTGVGGLRLTVRVSVQGGHGQMPFPRT